MNKQSQNKQILEHLKEGKRISALTALNKFGCLRLASRILELKDAGHDIKGEMVEHGGKRYKTYWI